MSGNGGMNTSATRAEALTFQSSVAGAVVPWLRGMHRVPGNLVWYGDLVAHAHTQQQGGKGGGGGGTSTSYTYTCSLVMVAAHGPIQDIPTVWKGKSQTTRATLGLTLLSGAVGQAVWSGLTGKGVEAIGYSGLAGVAVSAYDLGDNASVENHSFEVRHASAYGVSSETPDVDPVQASRELLIDQLRGAAMPEAMLGDWTEWSDYCVASGLLMSPLLLTQVAAYEALETVADLTNAAIYWSEGKLKVKPYGDSVITGNGRTFTPDTTPVYQLDDTCYDSTGGKVPVRVALKTGDDCFNSVTVEYKDRSNGYNVATVTAKDRTDIAVNGVRAMDTITAHWICDAEVARLVAELKKQRSLGVVGKYTLSLPWHFALIECMDLLTLTDSVLQMLDVPVRVIEITEESDDELTLVCEDYPPGMASAPRYPAQVPVGFATDALTAAPSVTDAKLFPAPVMLAAGSAGLEVWCAVRSPGGNWGGCTVWVSLDGGTYRRLSRVEGGARMGVLSGPISGGNLAVQGMSGQLLSGSLADAQALETLCYIAGDQPEFLAYQTATLTSAGAYTLTGLQRGAYNTGATSHTIGDKIIRIDDAIAKSGALDRSYVGKTIYFKCTSFNLYGAAEQSLADVSPFYFQVFLPPNAMSVTGLALQVQPGVVHASWNAVGYGQSYLQTKLYLGASFATAVLQGAVTGTSFDISWLAAGSYTLWAVHEDVLGSGGPPVSIGFTVSAANATTPNQAASNIGLPRGQALSVNPECNLPAEWNQAGSGAFTFVTGVAGVPYQTGVGNTAGTGRQNLLSKTPTPIDPSRRLRVSAFAYSNNGTGLAYLGIAWIDAAGAPIDSGAANPAGWSNGTYSYFGLINQTPPAAGQRYVQEFGAGVSGVAIPSNAVAALLVYLPNYSNTGGARHYVTDFKIEDITDVAAAQATATAAASAASTAATNATTALNRLAAIDSDGILSRGEKPEIIKAWTAVTGESSGIDTQAGALGITTERTAYVAAYYALSSYLSGLSPSYADTSQDTTIIPANDRAAWNSYYSARQTVLNAIAAKAATLANWAGVTGSGKPADNATKNTHYYQDTDPGAVDDGSIWISSTRAWQRIGGAWKPYVGTASVGTAEIAIDAATVLVEKFIATIDVTGTPHSPGAYSYAASYSPIGFIAFTPDYTGRANIYISANLLMTGVYAYSSADTDTQYVWINADLNADGTAQSEENFVDVRISEYVVAGRTSEKAASIGGRLQIDVVSGVTRTLWLYGSHIGSSPATVTLTNVRIGLEGVKR